MFWPFTEEMKRLNQRQSLGQWPRWNSVPFALSCHQSFPLSLHHLVLRIEQVQGNPVSKKYHIPHPRPTRSESVRAELRTYARTVGERVIRVTGEVGKWSWRDRMGGI